MRRTPDVIDKNRWSRLEAMKKADAIGRAFSLLEESVLHHVIERDGWTPSDECYMMVTQEARKLIEEEFVPRDLYSLAIEERDAARRGK